MRVATFAFALVSKQKYRPVTERFPDGPLLLVEVLYRARVFKDKEAMRTSFWAHGGVESKK